MSERYSILGLYLEKYCLDNYTNQDPLWVKFITDHYQYLRNGATELFISPEDMHTYRYRLEDYLEDKKYDKKFSWIIMLINQISSNKSFTNLSKLLIPNTNVLHQLRAQYDTHRALISDIEI